MHFETLDPSSPSKEIVSLPKLEEVANKLQILLMPLAYQEKHPEIPLNLTDPETRRAIANEWLGCYATEFRNYIEASEHAEETIDLNNPTALHNFLSKLKRESETLH